MGFKLVILGFIEVKSQDPGFESQRFSITLHLAVWKIQMVLDPTKNISWKNSLLGVFGIVVYTKESFILIV